MNLVFRPNYTPFAFYNNHFLYINQAQSFNQTPAIINLNSEAKRGWQKLVGAT